MVTVFDGVKYDTKELSNDSDLHMVADWNLPIFDMARYHPVTVLSRVSPLLFNLYDLLLQLTYKVFKQADLFRIFKLSPVKFFNYFHALEKGYWEIPCEFSSSFFIYPLQIITVSTRPMSSTPATTSLVTPSGRNLAPRPLPIRSFPSLFNRHRVSLRP